MQKPEITQQRTDSASQLIEDFNLRDDAEHFADPMTRIEFIKSLSPNEFLDLTRHINDRVRGFEPRDQETHGETGGYLPMLGTPEVGEKREAFCAGFETIRRYLQESTDTTDQKIQGAAMATEALIIWVHPFNDGNGRTSRFVAKFIESGSANEEQLIDETVDKNNRLRMYRETLRIDQANTAKGIDLILDDDDIEELKKSEMPVVDGISLSLKRLLEDKSLQEKVLAQTAEYKLQRAKWLGSAANKAA